MADAVAAAAAAAENGAAEGGDVAGNGTAAAVEPLMFKNINMIVRGIPSAGSMKIADKGLAFRSAATNKVHTVRKDELRKARWMQVARGYELRLSTSTGNFATFDGFKESDWKQLKAFFKQHFPKVERETPEVSIKGSNVGVPHFELSALGFLVDGNPAFEIPLNAVSNAMFQKTEAMLEFHLNDDAADDAQQLESMRFFIPGEADADIPDDKPPVQIFVDKVLSKAEVVKITGEAIAKFPEMPCVTPRGRYEIALHPNVLQLHSKSYTYKISYSTIIRLFLLPKPDQRHVYFIVNVDPPLRQGNTRYPFFVFQFPKEEETTVELNKEGASDKLASISEDTLTGNVYDVVSKLFHAMTGKKIGVPGKFNSKHLFKAVKCAHKGSDGFLYPLEKAFLFVHKPVFYLKFDDVAGVTFTRVTGAHSASQTFDLQVEMRNGAKFEFSAINRDEFDTLSAFIESKRLRITNVKGQQDFMQADEFELSDEEEGDPYMANIEQDLSDDDSSDESFKAPESSSDPDEEFDSDMGNSGSDAEGAEKPKKKKKKKAEGDEEGGDDDAQAEGSKKKKKSKSADKDDDEDGDDSGKKKKKKKKAKVDPNKPKRPKSAFLLFADSVREEVRSENPNTTMPERSKIIAEKWKHVDADARAEFDKQAEEARKEFNEKMAEYRKQNPEPESDDDDDEPKKKTKRKGKKPNKDPNAPKKPLSAYFEWLQENRSSIVEKNPEMNNKEVLSEAGRLWREMTSEQKQPFEEKANANKEKYVVDMEEYRKLHPEAAEAAASSPKQKSVKRKRKEDKDPKQGTIKFKSADIINSSEDDEPVAVPVSKPKKEAKKAKKEEEKEVKSEDDDEEEMHISDD